MEKSHAAPKSSAPRIGASIYTHPAKLVEGAARNWPDVRKQMTLSSLAAACHELGIDHLQVFPNPNRIADEMKMLLPWLRENGLAFQLNNEFGSRLDANGMSQAHGHQRYDVPRQWLDAARTGGEFLGVIYDECEHHQMHGLGSTPEQSSDGHKPLAYFADTRGLSVQAAHDKVLAAMQAITAQHAAAGTAWYSEHVFPVLMHMVARAGGVPAMKLLKEGFSAAVGLLGLGASLQYSNEFWLTPDFWGPDSGPWFRWAQGHPAHSPDEYFACLKYAYWLGVTGIYSETIESLAYPRPGGAMPLTEFGQMHRQFVLDYMPAHPRPYTFKDFAPEIAVLRYEDGYFGQNACDEPRFQRGPFGGGARFPESSQGWLDLWHLLSHDTIPSDGLTWYTTSSQWSPDSRHHQNLPPDAPPPAHHTKFHQFFYPLPNVGWFDEQASAKCLRTAKLIFLTGERMSPAAMKAVADRVRAGATVIAQPHLLGDLPGGGVITKREADGLWVSAPSFLDAKVRLIVEPYLGGLDEIRLKFGQKEVIFQAENGDRDRLVCNMD